MQRDPATMTTYLARLFEDPTLILGEYSEWQIASGIDFLCNSCHSYHLANVSESHVPLDVRRRALMSLGPLYGKLFLPLTSSRFGDPQRPCDNVCYMLWDLDSLYPPKDEPGQAIYWEAARRVLGCALRLPSYTIQRSALHGLGHVAFWMGRDVAPLIRPVIESKDLSPELRQYAEQAINGTVQ
jgi:hypothetical protein